MSSWETSNSSRRTDAGSPRRSRAVNLVRSTGRPIAAVARKLGYDSTLGNWVPQSRIDRARPRG
jgi:transposase-like protein